MIDPGWFLAACRDHGIDFVTGVPDSLLAHLNTQVMAELPADRHVIAANEGAAVGTAIGHFLRTGRPALVYLQNSGIGNAVNPLLSLADPAVYGIPMLLVVGWRGQPGVPDEPQHAAQGRVMPVLLDALGVPWEVLPAEQGPAAESLARMVAAAVERGGPAVLLVEKGTFATPSRRPEPGPAGDEAAGLPSREETLAALLSAVGGDPVIVSTTGMLSRELFELRVRAGDPGDRDFLCVGGMGHASAVALGVALREPEREVWCFDGDGALLMHLGSLAVVARQAPPRFFHAVFNNGVHDSVGGQPTAITVVDVPAVARALGYRYAARVADPPDPDALAAAVAAARAAGGPALLELPVRPGSRPDLGRPTRSPQQAKQAFMTAVR